MTNFKVLKKHIIFVHKSLIILNIKNMSLLSENVIPGKHGRVFGTDATKEADLLEIKSKLLEIEGITDVQLNFAIFPRKLTIFTDKMIPVRDIEHKVKTIGFHAIPD